MVSRSYAPVASRWCCPATSASSRRRSMPASISSPVTSTAASVTTRWRQSCTSSRARPGARQHARARRRRWRSRWEATMTTVDVKAGASYTPFTGDVAASETTRRLTIANIWVAVIAFTIAVAMAVMQAMSRANLDLPGRSPQMYYLSVTAHGVLMALVFTTFFIMALGWAIVRQECGAMPWPRASWIAFWVSVAGVLMTTWAILTHRASVLYTFYPPLQAHPAFYIGLTIVVVCSWEWAASIVVSWWRLRRAAPDRPVSLAMHSTTANAMLWLLATLGVAAEMLFQLIPWSLGWVKTIDPLLARTLFWFFGHPLVYFWILPAYTIWYTVLPRGAGL